MSKVSRADLAAARSAISALAQGHRLDRAELAAAVRTVCHLLAQRYPGGTVELRVPPFVAVQLGLGDRGRHTRGTPPSVVQTDALTVLALAGGQLAWADAVATPAVRASGVHSDLAALWPVPDLS